MWIDTLFGLPEVSIFAAAVDAADAGAMGQRAPRRDYATLYRDIRAVVDEAHADGSLKARVVEDLPTYLELDPHLGPALHRLRSAGKRLFLLTNSGAAYTDAVMNYVLPKAAEYSSYARYFDWVVTDARKPSFFTGRAVFREVLRGGALGSPAESLERGRVYAGGHLAALEEQLGVSGDGVLYVGDHIYGDVLRAKKESAWRTMMIVQEMEDELAAIAEVASWETELEVHQAQRDGLLDAIHEQTAAVRTLEGRLRDLDRDRGPGAPDEGDEIVALRAKLAADRARHKKASDRLRTRLRRLDADRENLEGRVSAAFHPRWGSLFKAGSELSSFGHQVEVFACAYTSRVSNLLAYSPTHYFHSPRDRMPHERR